MNLLLIFSGIVSVGTPPQTFEVVLDTGSDLFWLPETGCQSTGVDVQACSTGQGLYNPRSSSSAVNTNKAFGIRYGTGSASGNYYNDVMSVSKLHLLLIKLFSFFYLKL